jgi:N6-L-threonylcarbamoyladenine synthase
MKTESNQQKFFCENISNYDNILGLESSCDDTSVALFSQKNNEFLYEKSISQIDLHAIYGGVVPQLATREHLRHFPLILSDFIKKFSFDDIDLIAVTCGPGLPGSLFSGIACAKSISILHNKPIAGINHLRGHIFSSIINKIQHETIDEIKQKYFPQLHLLVSGGNTLLLKIDQNFDITVIAQTIDDAAGEALDKGAKLLGLPYPGGPEIEKYAANGDHNKYKFPIAFHHTNELKFSFSGLKTSLRYFLEKIDDQQFSEELNDICASYQFAVIEALMNKLSQCFKNFNFKSIGISGGVSNNTYLRMLVQAFADHIKLPVCIPEKKYTGDNASMIAVAAIIDPLHVISEINFYPNLQL